ncbi:hypothetical protein ACT6QH_11490 [Xanthobacter sp. TB0139]|uniref:hypothetical protein n=1 Tax=Xanthobacter sp. TB0139 TaxID=3459178 RepID=UPI0040395A6D
MEFSKMARAQDAMQDHAPNTSHMAVDAGGNGTTIRAPGKLLIGLLLGGALTLAGCASDGELGPAGGSAGSVGGVQNTAPGATMTVGAGPDALTYDCPGITVRTGASTLAVKDGQGRLRYQANIGQLARECAIVGNQMTAKVGIEGRVLLGEAGSPGTIKLPVRVAVVEEGPSPRTIASKLFTVPVTIPAGESQAAFTVVEDQITFPLEGRPSDMERYIFYIGYDGKAQHTPTSRPRRSSSSNTRTQRPAASAKPAPASTPTASAPKPAPSSTPSSMPDSMPTDMAAPPSDVFGPPPESSTATGGFAPPPSSSAFEPPPAASTN